ncbi:MAG TPA: alpha/beta fold hydrolase, partial [Solirubrobacteraceae bacterium]|nr:alpha/beta fold hydrolase [Solirubrobacteraceae bacterium]
MRPNLVTSPPRSLQTLIDRYDYAVFEPAGGRARVRLAVRDDGAWDAVLDGRAARLLPAAGSPDATISASAQAWRALTDDVRGGAQAYLADRLAVRRNIHLGVGFIAATSSVTGPERLRFRTLDTRRGRISTMEAGSGPPLVAIHGLGATKGSFLPTVAALAGRYRVIALDLPGFGDSEKPINASYDARFFASAITGLLDALELDRAHLIGNSLGGRVALEVAFQDPDRVGRLVL